MAKKKSFNVQKARQVYETGKGIERQVQILIERFNTLERGYFETAYKVLNAILQLRKTQIKNYAVNSLTKERGLKVTEQQVKYIFGMRFITPYTQDKIDRGLIKISTVLFIIKSDALYRIEENQKKVVDMFIKGKINTSDIALRSAENILNGELTSEEINKSDSSLTAIVVYLKHALRTIKARKEFFRDKNNLSQLKSTCSKILEEIKEI